MCFYSFCQLLESEKLLLILVDPVRVTIYLERLPAMDMAIQRHRPVKVLNREKLEQDILFAFDETKRSLAVCAPNKVRVVSLTSEFSISFFVTSFISTFSSSMRHSRRFRDKEVVLIFPHGIAKLPKLPLRTLPSYAAPRKWFS
jgi:hypothetical protein